MYIRIGSWLIDPSKVTHVQIYPRAEEAKGARIYMISGSNFDLTPLEADRFLKFLKGDPLPSKDLYRTHGG